MRNTCSPGMAGRGHWNDQSFSILFSRAWCLGKLRWGRQKCMLVWNKAYSTHDICQWSVRNRYLGRCPCGRSFPWKAPQHATCWIAIVRDFEALSRCDRPPISPKRHTVWDRDRISKWALDQTPLCSHLEWISRGSRKLSYSRLWSSSRAISLHRASSFPRLF